MRQSACLIPCLILAACRSGPSPSPTTAQEQKEPPAQGKIRIGDFLATPENCGMIHSARAVYPEEAKRAHIEGVVKFRVLITKAGEVADVDVLSGNPMLIPAATRAVKQFRYAPCRLNGELVEVKTEIDISFTLHQ